MNEHLRTGEAKMADEQTRRQAEGANGLRSIGEILRGMVEDLQKSCSQTTSYGKEEADREGVTSAHPGPNRNAVEKGQAHDG